jgi:hypothetical protein
MTASMRGTSAQLSIDFWRPLPPHDPDTSLLDFQRPYHGQVPHQRRSPTSRAGAETMAPKIAGRAKAILDILRSQGPKTRTELAQILGIPHPSSVTGAVACLLGEGFAAECGEKINPETGTKNAILRAVPITAR